MGTFLLFRGQISRANFEDLPRNIRPTDLHTLLLIYEGMKDCDRKDAGSILGANINYTNTHLALNVLVSFTHSVFTQSLECPGWVPLSLFIKFYYFFLLLLKRGS